jgi:hypothetical protein
MKGKQDLRFQIEELNHKEHEVHEEKAPVLYRLASAAAYDH